MLNTLLSVLNLDEDEVKTYLLLLETGPITVGDLAKKLAVPRSSLYGFLKRLQDRNLVIQSIKYNIKTFAAESPEKINLLFNQKKEELQKSQQLYQEILPELKKHQPSKFLPPRIQWFEGQEGMQNQIKDLFLYSDMETQSFWPIKKMLEILSPEFFRYMNKQRIRNNLSIRAIWPRDQIVDAKNHPYLGAGEKFLREFRIAPAGTDFSMGYWIYGNKVSFISSRKESFGFILESAEFAEMQLAQFDIAWRVSTPYKVNPADTETFLKELEQNL